MIQLYRPRLGDFVESAMFENLTLFDTEGLPLLSYKTRQDFGPSLLTGPMANSELASGFVRCRALLQPILTNIQQLPDQPNGAMFIVGPLFREGTLIGLLALELDNRQVFKSFNTYFGLGETGDVTIATEIGGNQLQFINATRSIPRRRLASRSSSAKRTASTFSGPSAASVGTPRCPTTWATWSSPPGPICLLSERGSRSSSGPTRLFHLLSQQRTGALFFLLGGNSGRLHRGSSGGNDDQSAHPRGRAGSPRRSPMET